MKENRLVFVALGEFEKKIADSVEKVAISVQGIAESGEKVEEMEEKDLLTRIDSLVEKFAENKKLVKVKPLMVALHKFYEIYSKNRDRIKGNLREKLDDFFGVLILLKNPKVHEQIKKTSLCKGAVRGSVESKICDFRNINPLDQLHLLHDTRSNMAIQELTKILGETLRIEDKTLTLFYPGSGSHLDPLWVVKGLMDQGKIEVAELMYKEISQDSLVRLKKNLRYLSLIDPNFTYRPDDDDNSDSNIFHVDLEYKGKPINLVFLLSRGGRIVNKQLSISDVYLSHDSVDGDPLPQ